MKFSYTNQSEDLQDKSKLHYSDKNCSKKPAQRPENVNTKLEQGYSQYYCIKMQNLCEADYAILNF